MQDRTAATGFMESTTPVAPAPPPDLGSVITTADVQTKGTGSYAADYVNWCRIAHLLHVHAPGWQFQLVADANGNHVHRAPDGTGYVMGQFTSPEGFTTAPFPQAVMDNRNNAIPLERISARDVTDTHRRCLCTAAAAQFSLAWQLWAREPVEDPHRQPQQAPAMDADEMQRRVLHRLKDAGITAEGMSELVSRATDGNGKGLGQIAGSKLTWLLNAPDDALDAKVAECNEAAAAAAADADDPPLSWTAPDPEPKPTSRGRQRSTAAA